MSGAPDIPSLLNENRFEEVIPLLDRTLRTAAAESSEELARVARAIVAWRGVFANAQQEIASEVYFRAVYVLLGDLAGEESPEAMAAAENLAGILGANRSH